MEVNPAKLTMTEFGLAAVIESTENETEKIITVSVPILAKNMNHELEEGMDENVLVKTGQDDILNVDEDSKESRNSNLKQLSLEMSLSVLTVSESLNVSEKKTTT